MKNSLIDLVRVDNNSAGNPRYVCHFLNFITKKDEGLDISQQYRLALNRAKEIGGKKFSNKQYGGGIVFQVWNPEEIEVKINNLLKNL